MRAYLALTLTSVLVCSATSVEEPSKRKAPSGFTGVRGKKSVSEADYEATSDTNAFPDMTSGSGPDKRAPSGFMGMRGKKLFADEIGNYAEGQGAPAQYNAGKCKICMRLSKVHFSKCSILLR